MISVVDAWRAVDPASRLVSGDPERLRHPVRGVARTRAAAPHLPPLADGQLLVADASVLPGVALDRLTDALGEAGLAPSAIWIASRDPLALERSDDGVPILHGLGAAASVAEAIGRYLADEATALAALSIEIRLAAAEAALADPQPAAPAGVAASRLRRGVAITVDGALRSLNPRPAGRALATRFAAAHERLLADRSGPAAAARRTRDGLWVLERSILTGATAWLFDDLPFARVDQVALESLALTMRALLRRRPTEPARSRRGARAVPSSGDPFRDTLIAVARANGRVAPAARALGVHRNTVLYRLRRASVELGIDPRRPEDAIRLLRGLDGRD